MTQELFFNRWFTRIAGGITLLCLALFAYTQSFLLLIVPFGVLFMGLMAVNYKAAWWMLLFSLPFSTHLEFFNATLGTSVPDEPMMWLFLLLFGVLFAHNPKILPEWWWRNPIVLVVVVQFLWLIVTVIFSTEVFISVKFLAAKVWFLVAFFIFPLFIFREKKDFKKAFVIFLVPLVITVLIIFYRHSRSGFNFRRIEKAIANIYYNHVDYSTILSMFWPILLVAFPLSKGQALWKRLSILGVLLFLLPAIYLTYARAAMLAIVFALVVVAAIKLKLVNIIMPAIYGVVALAVVYMVNNNKYIDFRPMYERTYMHKTFTDHMIATFKGRDMSSMERLYRWIAGARMSTERPVTGYGPNSFYFHYKPYAVSSFRTYVSRNVERSTTHNYYLLMLVEQGWPGLILYGILVMVVLAHAQKVYHRFKDRFYKWVTLGVVMMFSAAWVNNFFSELIETHKVGGLFYIALALLIVLDRKSRQAKEGDEAALA